MRGVSWVTGPWMAQLKAASEGEASEPTVDLERLDCVGCGRGTAAGLDLPWHRFGRQRIGWQRFVPMGPGSRSQLIDEAVHEVTDRDGQPVPTFIHHGQCR